VYSIVYTVYTIGDVRVERAFVCVTTSPPSVQRVLEEIKAVEGVESAHMVFGAYDVCFSVKRESLDKLKHILSERIKKINDVRAILTLFSAKPE
jgi:DNA-binding Lrp family transcriptional regulator